jgi:hypothetical protein
VVCAGHSTAQGEPADPPQTAVDYNRDIHPILAENCYECHGPDAGRRRRELRLDTRDGALAMLPSGNRAVVPGQPAQSELVRRTRATLPLVRMPPRSTGRTLSDLQLDLLERWIAEGAPWERHWSFISPGAPEVPTLVGDWGNNEIDQFVLARLDIEGLGVSPRASRESLIRRVSLDLTGLPPTPQEIDAFLADWLPWSYERLVDRLLTSPRYGEHMARYWLDAARYGDTHGFHLDNERSLWPWRDWVIEAFNDNMPFDQFTVEQLAGDLLPEPTLSQRVATGFNRSNVTTGEGGLIAEEYLVRYAVDRVNTTATVWMGLTVGCAQCHDHKYDPITQREFYELFAFFNNVSEEGSDKNALTPPPFLRVPSAADDAELADLDGRIADLARRMDAPMPSVDRSQTAWEEVWKKKLSAQWQVLTPKSSLSRGGASMRILPDHSIQVEGASPPGDVYEVVARTELTGITAIRLEALVDETRDGNRVGRAANGNFVLTGFEVEATPRARPLDAEQITLRGVSADYSQHNYDISGSLDQDRQTGWAIDGRRQAHTAVFQPDRPFGFEGGTILRLRLRQESPHRQHNLGRFRLSISNLETVAPSELSPWLMVGPFAAETAALAFETAFGPEYDPDPRTTYTDAELSWIEKPEFKDGVVHELVGERTATYLRRTIRAPGERSMTLSFGSDDGIAVWLNGDRVLDRNVRRGAARDQERVIVRLRPGENQLLLKIVNDGGDYGFYFRVLGEDPSGVPTAIEQALLRSGAEGSGEPDDTLRRYFRRNHSPPWKALDDEMAAVAEARRTVLASIPVTMIMEEREERRKAHVLMRGQYDNPGEEVHPGTPASLPPLPQGQTADRLALARWLVDPDHPLTARVTVNRFWQIFFGVGIVKTTEDFGSRGEPPSHPELLDWLATDFAKGGWDVKRLVRNIVTSATYRQSSRITPESYQRDEENRLLSRGPRYRLDAEVIRDSALSVSGLLVGTLGGPSVKPYQPPGIWQAVGYPSSNTATFERDRGPALYRRSMYTFWKRTAPPPTMSLFDAPSREACTVQRARTNTPLQALVLMNDVQFVEAARALAQRLMLEGGTTTAERIASGFRLVTGRRPEDAEVRTAQRVYEAQLADYRRDPHSAEELLAFGEFAPEVALDRPALAAWTIVASMLLNLDETLTKR